MTLSLSQKGYIPKAINLLNPEDLWCGASGGEEDSIWGLGVLNSVLGLSYQSDYPSDTSKKVQIIQPGIALGALIAPNYQQQ